MKLPIRPMTIAAGALVAATLAGCVAPMPVYETARYPYNAPPQVQPYPQARGSYVEYGRVANIEVVRSESAGMGTSGGGAIAGGLIGGAVGNQIGSGSGRAAATALGLVGGALLGNNIEAQRNAPRVYESYRVSVQTEHGGWRAFDVPSPGDLRIGDRVRIDNGQISRL